MEDAGMEDAGHSLLCVPQILPFLVSHAKGINPSAITVAEGRVGRCCTEGESRAWGEFRLVPVKESLEIFCP